MRGGMKITRQTVGDTTRLSERMLKKKKKDHDHGCLKSKIRHRKPQLAIPQ